MAGDLYPRHLKESGAFPREGGKAVALLTTASQNCVRARPYNVYIDHCLLLILCWETVVTEGAETAKKLQKNHEFQ